jgi:tetratricopeptide (TPR) repeat protein
MGEIVNPYIAGAPVTEKRMFFGREDIFQWIENSITGQYADHILVIHGQRRVGKTSVLKQLGNRLPKRYIPVFFDLQGRTHTTLDRFLWWLAREIVRVLKQERGIEVSLPEKEDFARDLEHFENRFLPDLKPVLDGSTLLLTFDEFDNLEDSEIKEELGRPLVDHLRRLMGSPGLNFIFSIGSSGRKLENMQAAYTDFFKTALYKKISFLNEEQTHGLITRPVKGVLEYERAAVGRIYQIASGHPYFTQLTCHELFARCQRTEQRKVAESDVEAILEDVVERGTVNLKFVWDEAADIEKWSLSALAHLDKNKSDIRTVADYLRKQHVRFSETDLTSGLLRLREKDVLTPENRFVVHLLRLWLQKNRPIEQAREELTEVNPIANRYIEIGLEFKDSRLYDKAVESFQEALAISKDNLQAQVNIALTYMDQKLYDKAIVEFEKALTMDDEDVSARAGLCEAHLALGDAFMRRSRMKDAVLSYQRVLAINAEHTEARGRMAEISCQRAEKALLSGRDEDALSAFTEALRFTPEDPKLIAHVEQFREEKKSKILAFLLASAEKESGAGNWDAAIKSLEEALPLSPTDASIPQKLADARAAQVKEGALAAVYADAQKAYTEKNYDQAVGLFKKIILEDENYRDASRLLMQAIELRRTAPKWWHRKAPQAVERTPLPRLGSRVSPKKILTIGAASILVLGLIGGLFWFAQNGLPAIFVPAADKTSTASPPPAGTPDPRVLNPANQHLYLYVNSDKTWHEARDYCALQGGYLATIQDSAENNYVSSLLAGDTWLGATDELEEGIWVWVSGEPWGYTNWDLDTKQPDNDQGQEHYLEFKKVRSSLSSVKPSDWNDKPGTEKNFFVCEWDPEDSGLGVPSPTLDPDIQSALDIIQSEEPLYQTSFDAWDFGDIPEDVSVENGKLIIASRDMEQHRSAELENLVSENFAVEFDLRVFASDLFASDPKGNCGFSAYNTGDDTDERKRVISANFSANKMMDLNYYADPKVAGTGIHLTIEGSVIPFDRSAVNTITLIFLRDQISVFMNGNLAHTVFDPRGSFLYRYQNFFAQSIRCEFDNYKIWDLSGDDFSTSTETTPAPTTSALQQPAWVTEFAEPILAAISGQSPHVQDDIETATTPWLNNHDGAPFKRIDGEMITSDSNYSWKMWYTDFVIKLDYRFLPSATRDQSWTILFRGAEGFTFHYDGEVGVNRYLQQGESLSNAAQSGGSVNHVIILVKDEAAALFINDQPVYYGDLPSGFKSGEASWGFGANIAYDNFEIWNLNDLP